MKKRVLILANFDVGLYKFRKELIKELLSRDCEVFLSLPDGEFIPPLVRMGCTFLDTPVDRRGINPATDLSLFRRYRRMLKKVRPNLVITYTVKPNIYGGIACRFSKVPYAVNVTGLGTAFQNKGLLKKLVVRLYKTACRRAKVVFFENKENQGIFVEHGIVPLEQTCRLNGAGVNLEEYPLCAYPSDDGETRFLFVGRVMREKGVGELFEAAKKIRAQYKNVFFDIVGPLEDDYRETIERLEKEGVIRYHGFQADVRPFYARCHCFVLPSYHEGMANTLLEAGAVGRPLITSRIAGCMEAVAEGETGFLCGAQDVRSLEESLREFLSLPLARRAAMGSAARAKIQREFDKNRIVEQTLSAVLSYEAVHGRGCGLGQP